MKFYVADGARIKVATEECPAGEFLEGGACFDAEEEDVQNLLNSGSISGSKGSSSKSKKTKKSGKEVETPKEEGKLNDDGETPEVK